MSRLVCRPEQELPVATLRLAGELDETTVPAVRDAVNQCLIGQPDAVVVDLADLAVPSRDALAVFPAMAEAAARWPAVPLVLHSPGEHTAAQLAAAGTSDAVPVYATRSDALDEVRGAAGAVVRVRERLQPVPSACRQARELVADACARWRRADLASTAAVVATELVSNVVRHARTGMELTLGWCGGRLSIAVRDRAGGTPRPGEPGVSEAGGRGLRLVRDLTDAWGVLPGLDGKVVWASLR